MRQHIHKNAKLSRELIRTYQRHSTTGEVCTSFYLNMWWLPARVQRIDSFLMQANGPVKDIVSNGSTFDEGQRMWLKMKMNQERTLQVKDRDLKCFFLEMNTNFIMRQ